MPWTIWAHAPPRQQCVLDFTDPHSVKPVIMVSGFLHQAETGQGPCTSFGIFCVQRAVRARCRQVGERGVRRFCRHAASIPPGTMRAVKIVGKRASVCGYGKNCTPTLSWFRCSRVRYQKHITVGAKRFRCAEVLFQPKGLRAPRRKHPHCLRETCPLRQVRAFHRTETGQGPRTLAITASQSFAYLEVNEQSLSLRSVSVWRVDFPNRSFTPRSLAHWMVLLSVMRGWLFFERFRPRCPRLAYAADHP